MTNRFLLCRPDAGLNDVLCQIEHCWRYANKTDRTVIVDTAYRHSGHFNDVFDRYFESLDRHLILDAGTRVDDWNAESVYPAVAEGRLSTYEPFWSEPHNGYCDRQTGLPLTFDFRAEYPHRILLHHGVGGSEVSFLVLARLRLRRRIVEEIARRIAAIGGPYDAIHVRHTDYRTDYAGVLERLRATLGPSGKLFVATDNVAVLDEFRATLGPERVFSFSALPDEAGVPVHSNRAIVDVTARNTDALVDLLMLALARQLIVLPVRGVTGLRYSGFSILARNLWSSKAMLRHVLGRRKLEFW